MRTNHFTAIKSLSDKLLLSLRVKFPRILNGFSISVLSEKDFQQSLQNKDNLKQVYFTKDELDYCKNRVSSLAGRFAAKTAINEALQKDIPWKDINILSSQTGEPVLSFSDNIKYQVSFSISHEDDLISAFAVVPSPGNTIAVGVDATSINRISALLPQEKILKKILTPHELDEIGTDPVKMAEKWAAKEAVSKAIGIGIWHGASLREIEIINYKGKPTVALHGKVLQQAKTKGLSKWTVDYINDKKFLLAAVLATN